MSIWCEECQEEHEYDDGDNPFYDDEDDDDGLTKEETRLILQPQLRDLVKKGYCLLNDKVPAWQNRIKLDDLYLSSSSSCVLGQLYYGYTSGVNALNIEGPDFGFDVPDFVSNNDRHFAYELLDELWKEAIIDW